MVREWLPEDDGALVYQLLVFFGLFKKIETPSGIMLSYSTRISYHYVIGINLLI